MKNNRTFLVVGVIIALAISLPIGWYLLSPLWINRTVEEAFPTTSASKEEMGESMSEEVKASATAAMEDVMDEPDKVMEEAMPDDMASMTVITDQRSDLLGCTQVCRITCFDLFSHIIDQPPDILAYIIPGF